VKTGNCLAPIVMHGICNLMGFPKFSWISLQSEKDYLNAIAYVFGLVTFIFLLVKFDGEQFQAI